MFDPVRPGRTPTFVSGDTPLPTSPVALDHRLGDDDDTGRR